MSGSGGAPITSLAKKTLNPSPFLSQGDPGPAGEPGSRGPTGEAGPEVEYSAVMPEHLLQHPPTFPSPLAPMQL